MANLVNSPFNEPKPPDGPYPEGKPLRRDRSENELNGLEINDLLNFSEEFLHSPPSDSPFYNTDIVIINDQAIPKDKHGKPLQALPLNVVSESEYAKINALFNEIVDGKTKFMIGGDVQFAEEIYQAVCNLLTRRKGRQLIEKLLSNDAINCIGITKGNRNECFQQLNLIKLNLEQLRTEWLITQTEKGNATTPNNIASALAHELLHLQTYRPQNLFKKPTINPEFNNLEEQKVITGWEENLPKPAPSIPVDEFQASKEESEEQAIKELEEELNAEIPSFPVKDYSELNENDLRADFGLAPRTTHMGVVIPKDLKMTAKNAHNIFKFVQTCCHFGFIEELGQFLKANLNDRGVLDSWIDDANILFYFIDKLTDKQFARLINEYFLKKDNKPATITPFAFMLNVMNNQSQSILDVFVKKAVKNEDNPKEAAELLSLFFKGGAKILPIEANGVLTTLKFLLEGEKTAEPLFKLFLERPEFNMAQQDDNGETVLHLALRRGDRNLIMSLWGKPRFEEALKKKDNKGNTPLHSLQQNTILSESSKKEFEQELLRLGLSPDIRNRDNKTYLEIDSFL